MRALASVNAAKGFESGFVIVVVAIALRSIFQREVK
jgi:glycine betaine/proline transport system permease protein